MNELNYIFGLPSLMLMRPLDVMLLIYHLDSDNKDVWLRLYSNKVATLAAFSCRWSPYRRHYIYSVSFPDNYIQSLDISFSQYITEKRVCLKSKDILVARLKFSLYVLDFFTQYYCLISKS